MSLAVCPFMDPSSTRIKNPNTSRKSFAHIFIKNPAVFQRRQSHLAKSGPYVERLVTERTPKTMHMDAWDTARCTEHRCKPEVYTCGVLRTKSTRTAPNAVLRTAVLAQSDVAAHRQTLRGLSSFQRACKIQWRPKPAKKPLGAGTCPFDLYFTYVVQTVFVAGRTHVGRFPPGETGRNHRMISDRLLDLPELGEPMRTL